MIEIMAKSDWITGNSELMTESVMNGTRSTSPQIEVLLSNGQTEENTTSWVDGSRVASLCQGATDSSNRIAHTQRYPLF